MCNKAQRLKVVEKREEKNRTCSKTKKAGKGGTTTVLRTGTSVLYKVGQNRDKGALEKRTKKQKAKALRGAGEERKKEKEESEGGRAAMGRLGVEGDGDGTG